jgi:predicted XRE-type DNA-binding protein
MRARLLMGLEHWLEKSRMTQAKAATVLGVTARAGLKPRLKLVA